MDKNLLQNWGNLKTQIKKLSEKYPEMNLEIVISDSREPENNIKIDGFEEIPDLRIISEELKNPNEITLTVFLDSKPVRKYLLTLSDAPEEPAPAQQNNTQQNDFEKIIEKQMQLFTQMFRTQELINEQKLKSLMEINELKLENLKNSFHEISKQREEMFYERLELEREKLSIESDEEKTGIFAKALKEIVSELIPVGKELAQAYIESKTKIVNPVRTKGI